ncbi:PRTRC genetic system protein B [Chryseobacterium sp. 52]|uniref:PRTRC system protein B n=1 Tax=Chryseobacterium sp. 52 TaxID=2035213 RepID=UPI000C193A1C|nr:PRTRC system protein B [Chryseobacterium sp. 52]PIF45357.1 PRTRC genetic system protein B [Chryseobacterium sp. 52]
MSNLHDITENFNALYHPKSALVFYEAGERKQEVYVEHFDMDQRGCLINAHPLTEREAGQLAKSLKVATEKNQPFLKSQGIMGSHILQIDPVHNGVVIWFTKAMGREMHFTETLGIPNGIANVPPMLWVANRNKLFVYAMKTNTRPTEKTLLYHAPFFNVYSDGNVCMGTVDVRIRKTASLEEFTNSWENYFFNSYFSHLVNSHNPIKGNCASLWKKMTGSNENFPKNTLKKADKTLKNLLK